MADRLINEVLDAMDRAGLSHETIIIRTSDHGELGLSHGLREKSYAAYDEILHVPLVISNPLLFPNPRTTRAIYSHVHLAATMSDLAGIPPLVWG